MEKSFVVLQLLKSKLRNYNFQKSKIVLGLKESRTRRQLQIIHSAWWLSFQNLAFL